MEIGVTKPVNKTRKKLRKTAKTLEQLRGAGGGSNNGNSGGGGSGGDGKSKKEMPEFPEQVSTEKSKVLMWFLLLVVIMTFGGLISAYVVIATNAPYEWEPLNSLPFQVWVSTAIILASSITYCVAKKALVGDQNIKSKKWFLATALLGATFISSQLTVWYELVSHGLYMQGNPYVGFFYILTAVHAVHVLGGTIALGYIILKIWNKTLSHGESKRRKADASVIGWYWHTMGGLWLVLLFLLGFWK